MPVLSTTQLSAIERLSRLLQAGPLGDRELNEAVRLAADGGEVGASLLRAALQRDAFEPGRQSGAVQGSGSMQGSGGAPGPTQGPTQGGGPVQGGGSHGCQDVTPPQTPYTQVFLGAFADPQVPARGRDPLVLRLSHLESDASVYLINRRAELGADKNDQARWVKVPWDGKLDAEGRANVVLSDAEAARLGIRGGDVLELFQVDQAGNVSGSDWVAINERAPGARINNPLGAGPTSWVGVQSSEVRAQFITEADGTAPAADGTALCQRLSKSNDRWELVLTPKKGKLALEPFSKVVVDKPPFDTGHYTQDVKRDGSFELKTWDAGPQDAVVLRVFDHSTPWSMGQGAKPTERRVVLAAGGGDAVVVDNPAAGTQKKLEASLSRISLSKGELKGAPGAATPGSIVLVINQSTGKKTTTAVGPDGSFARSLAANVGDKLSIQLLHAFDEPALRVDLGVHTVGCDVAQLGACTPAVGGNGAPDRLQAAVERCELGFSTYDWNTGNYATLAAKTDWSGRVDSVFTLDPASNEVVVTVSIAAGGGLRESQLGELKHTQAAFGAAGRSNWTNNNPAPTQFRQEIARRGKGGSWPVRFQTTDGHVFARGNLKIDSVIRTHSTGSSQKDHPVWTASLEPGSLVAQP
ncbi:MAG: hypothetical protein IT383_01745 [Deltaproteobacteria bacterium]|nr:hypothetical protein [Deltaproteobacteria bacterium]